MYAIYIKRILPVVDNNVWLLTFYNNVNAMLLFLPLMLVMGEFSTIISFPGFFSFSFWFLMTIGGFFGCAIGYVTGLQVKVHKFIFLAECYATIRFFMEKICEKNGQKFPKKIPKKKSENFPFLNIFLVIMVFIRLIWRMPAKFLGHLKSEAWPGMLRAKLNYVTPRFLNAYSDVLL
jgi:hypothetical protein